MEAVLFMLLIILALLSYFWGVDSRVWDDRDRRPWWPGARP